MEKVPMQSKTMESIFWIKIIEFFQDFEFSQTSFVPNQEERIKLTNQSNVQIQWHTTNSYLFLT